MIVGNEAITRKYLKSADVRKEKSEIKKTLGETLKAHRTRCKMTQEFVAESLGVSRQAVSKWESGNGYPETEKLLIISKELGVSLDALLDNASMCRKGVGKTRKRGES